MRERVKILSPCNFVRGRRGVPGRLLVRRGRKRQDSLCRRHVCCYGRLSIGCRVLWQMLAPPQSLQTLLRRLCWQMLAPPQSLHLLLRRLCWQMPVPPQSLHLLLMQLCWQILAPPQSLQVLLLRLC